MSVDLYDALQHKKVKHIAKIQKSNEYWHTRNEKVVFNIYIEYYSYICKEK